MFRLYSLLFTLILVGHSSAQSFGQRIFWNEPTNNRIQVGALSAGAISGPQTLAPGIANLEDIAIAPSSGYIFYIQATSGLVRASLVDGSGTFVLRDFGAFTGFNDIAYSGNANGVFTPLIEEEHGASFFDESSGSETQLTLGGFNNDDYVAVTVHDGNEEVFFINDDQQGIFKCPDFSCNSLIQIIGQTGLECLTDDEFNNKIYFTATSGPTTMLYSANLDGSALTGLADLGSAYITSIQAYSKIGKIYYVKYNDGIYSVDIDGNNSNTLVLSLAGTGVTDIAIEPDLTPPVLTGTSPEDNAVNVTNNESLSLNFDGKVFISSTAGTANEQSIRIYETVGNVLVQTIDRSSSDISISLNLASVFNITTPKINTEYYVLIGSKVFRDNANNDYTGISSNTTWNFKTTPGVTVSAPSATTCTGTYVTLPDIVITEVANSDFSQGANQTLVLTAGSGYTFEPGTGTVTFGSGADISAASIVVTASDVTVTYSVDLIAGADALTISGLKFTTSSSTNPGADITRTGGTGVIAGLANGRVVGSTYSQTGSSAPTGTYPNGTNLCAGFDLSQTLIDITGAAVKWYTDAGLTLEQVPMAGVTNATGTALGIDNNTPATYTYYVTQTSGGCESAATMFSFTVNALPPAYDQTATVCSSSANDVDLTVHHAAITEGAPNTIVEWFDDAGLTNPIADPTSAAVVDTQMLHAKVTNTLSACTAQATVTFTVDDGPVVADQTFQVCEGVAGSGSAVVDLTTYDGTLTDGAANLTVAWLDISNNPIGSPAAETVTDGEVFHGRVTNTTTTCSTIANGTFDILQLPTTADAGPDQTVCGGAAVLAANTPTVGTGVWSIVSGGAGTFVSTSNPNTTFTPSGGTNYTLRWTITNATCTPSTNDVIIQFTTPPTMAAAGPDQQVCGTSAGLAGNTPTVGTGAWTIVSGVGGTITSPANPTSGFTGVVGTTYVLRWTITNGSCTPSFDEVTIQHLALPSVAAAGPDQNVCGTGATLAGNTPAVGTGAWSIISGSGGTIANPASPTSGFTGAAGTNYTLRWTISAACTSTEDDVVIQLSAAPSTAVAGSDQTVCTTTVALGATTPAVGSGLWSIVSGAGGNIATPSSPTSGFTGVTGTTYVVRWTVSNGGCTPSTDDVSISLITTPTTAAAGPDQNICGTSATLAGNTPVSGTGTWSVITGSGGTIANPSSPTSNFTGTGGTTYTLRWSISNACANSTDDVTIQMITPPTVAAAGPDQNVCSGTVNLAGNTPTSGTGAWTIVSGAGGSITTPSSATSSFTGVAGTMYVLRWTISSPGCTPTSDEVNIQINSLPGGTGTINGITSLCPGVTATYTISGITNATDYQWQLSDGFELVSATGPSANIRAVSGAGGVIQVVGQNSCGTGGTAQHAVNILPPPDVTIVSPSETFVNEVISVSFTTTSNITTQTWSFGDNGSANTPSADHTYTGGGDFTIQLDVVDSKECINSVSKTIRVNAEAELSNSSIKNVITANGDEKNAYLYIERIERFPESEVILLDRIGVEVFRQKNYQNDWDLRKGEDYLPAGNYICVVRYNGKIYSRSVTVIKGK